MISRIYKNCLLISCALFTINCGAWELYRFGPTWNWVGSNADANIAQFEFPAYEPSTVGYMAGALTTTSPYFTGDLRGKTITCRVSLATNGSPNFVFGGEVSGWNTGPTPPHFRLFLTSNPGPFSVSQSNADQLSYWWCRSAWVSLDALTDYRTVVIQVNISASLWTAAHAQRSDDYAAEFQDCVSRTTQVGIMFGGGSFFDVGCAVMPGTGTATLTLESFTVTIPDHLRPDPETYDAE